MKRLVLLLVALCLALIFVPSANPSKTEPDLGIVASRIAGQTVTVNCYKHGEPDDPWAQGAWGYVYIGDPVEYMAAEVCDGALGIHDDSQPRWKQALGALVIAHESYHLNLKVPHPESEARTECRAIKHFIDTAEQLGASEERANELLPYALAMHFRIGAIFSEYNLPSCNVPWYWGDE